MCLIIASPSGKNISREIVLDAAERNRDGGGIAWFKDGRIHFRKGKTAEEVLEILAKEAEGNPWVVHFRISTVGGVRPELTHPFTIDAAPSLETSGTSDAVLFHNGQFHGWQKELKEASAGSGIKLPEDPWSDTRAVAFICHVMGKYVLSLLDGASRWLVFDANEQKEKRMMVWGDWHDKDGFKFSNKGTCAFETQGANNYYRGSRAASVSAPGGGQANFPQAGREPAAGSANSSGKSESAQPNSESSPNQTLLLSENSNSTAGVTNLMVAPVISTSGEPVIVSSTKRASQYRPKRGHNIWQNMNQRGLYICARNEQEPNHIDT